MLLWLTEYLSEFVSGFSVFQYLTFRTMVSVVTALVMSLVIGPVVINRLTHHQIGQRVRDQIFEAQRTGDERAARTRALASRRQVLAHELCAEERYTGFGYNRD